MEWHCILENKIKIGGHLSGFIPFSFLHSCSATYHHDYSPLSGLVMRSITAESRETMKSFNFLFSSQQLYWKRRSMYKMCNWRAKKDIFLTMVWVFCRNVKDIFLTMAWVFCVETSRIFSWPWYGYSVETSRIFSWRWHGYSVSKRQGYFPDDGMGILCRNVKDIFLTMAWVFCVETSRIFSWRWHGYCVETSRIFSWRWYGYSVSKRRGYFPDDGMGILCRNVKDIFLTMAWVFCVETSRIFSLISEMWSKCTLQNKTPPWHEDMSSRLRNASSSSSFPFLSDNSLRK